MYKLNFGMDLDEEETNAKKKFTYNEKMLSGFIQILLFQGIGELASRIMLPFLPGPVIGLIFLLLWLTVKKEVNTSLAMVGDGLSQYLGLLFVPAAVGVVLFLPQLKENAVAIFCALVGSVVLTIGASAFVLKLFASKQASDD
jgi:putative effector of murein hydrolase LrgA (UPF0299 family)